MTGNTIRTTALCMLVMTSMLCASISSARESSGPTVWQNQSVYKWVRDGFSELNDGQFERASELFNRAAKHSRQPFEQSWARYGQAAVLMEQGRDVDAVIMLERVVVENRLPDAEHFSAIDTLISHHLAEGNRERAAYWTKFVQDSAYH